MDLENMVYDDDDLDDLNLIIFGIPRRIYQRNEYFYSFDEETFFRRFRIYKETALYLLALIENQLEYPYNLNNALAPINQLLIFLRFCATGTHYSAIADFGGLHPSTVCRIIVRVGRAVALLHDRFVKMPQNQEERDITQLKFYEKARFPRVLGVIDCTHIKIQSPGGADAEVFRNRKGYFSVNTQVIANADLKIMNVVARWPGSTHDVTIFNNSRVRLNFEENMFPNCLLLGDSGYNVRPYLFTPLLNPVTQEEQLYNESHIRTRNIIERLFGVWKRRFPVLAYGSRMKLQTTLMIIVSLAVLHNICRERNEEEPPAPEDLQLFLHIMEEDQVPNVPFYNNEVAVGFDIRRNFIQNYFHDLNE